MCPTSLILFLLGFIALFILPVVEVISDMTPWKFFTLLTLYIAICSIYIAGSLIWVRLRRIDNAFAINNFNESMKSKGVWAMIWHRNVIYGYYRRPAPEGLEAKWRRDTFLSISGNEEFCRRHFVDELLPIVAQP